MLDIHTLHHSFLRLAETNGFDVESLDIAQEIPLLILSKNSLRPTAPSIYISAGIHGDEPAGTLALERLLQNHFFSEHFNWTLFPMLNPYGLAHHSRLNKDGVDLNRDYRHLQTTEVATHVRWLEKIPRLFHVSLHLHEDYEGVGFYMYELTLGHFQSASKAITQAVAPFCPIDMSPIIEGHPASEGIIRPASINDLQDMPLWPEAVYHALKFDCPSYTLETPSPFPLDVRINAQCAAIESGLKALGFI